MVFTAQTWLQAVKITSESLRLYELNPALNSDCSGLWVGYAYCIGTMKPLSTLHMLCTSIIVKLNESDNVS